MIIHSELDRPFRVIGIDPGTENLGFSVLDLDLRNGQVSLSHSETIVSQKLLADYRNEERIHGQRTARLMSLEDRLFIIFEQYQPQAVCCESPFMHRFPQAFAALTECVSYVKRALYRYDRFKPITMVDPPTAKMSVGVTVKRGVTKEDVAAAIPKLNLHLANDILLENLDEHEIDSIAVAYYLLSIFRNQIPDLSPGDAP